MKYNRPIRISSKVMNELKCIKGKKKLKSYDAVIEKLLKKDGKI